MANIAARETSKGSLLRDILTIIASVVILILVAALAVPPLVNWEGHRETIDRMIARAAGTEAKTEGRISLRLLPSPRIRLDRLRLGGATPDSPSLSTRLVWAEMDLTPLLRGEVRFTSMRIGRAEIRVPTGQDGAWRLPTNLASGGGGRELAVESLVVAQLLVTTQVQATGRTDQFYAQGVRIEGQKLTGPWRVEGTTGGVPFRLVTGELGADRTIQVKLSGGGDVYPRFDIDSRLNLDATSGSGAAPFMAGKAKLLFGPPAQAAAAGIPIPIVVESEFKTRPNAVDLSGVTLDAGEGGASLRLTGEGSVRLNDWRIALKLEGRRLDADSFILSASGQDFASRLRQWSLPLVRTPIDLDLKLDSIGLAQDDLTNATARLTLARGRARVEQLAFTAPGDTRVALSGEFGLAIQGGLNGRLSVASNASDRFARYLNRLRINSPALAALDGRPFEASTDFAFVSPVLSFNRMRVKAGDALLGGNLRYTAPEGDQRGKLEAQIALQNLNLDQLPQLSNVFDSIEGVDVGITLDARGISAGRSPPTGRISARVLSDGPALVVETLDIVDLAGANMRVSGRIAPDGSGRITGKITAPRAAPLIDLAGSVWIGGVSKLVPYFLREGALDVDLTTERVAPPSGSSELRLRTTARGSAAGGAFEGQVDAVDGRTESLRVAFAVDNAGRWVNRTNVAGLNRPSRLELRGTRVGSGVLNVTLSGDLAGLSVTTTRPFTLGEGDDVVESGEAEVSSADATSFLRLLGDGAGVSGPIPLQARLSLGRERDATLIDLKGQAAGQPVQARLAVRSRADLEGEISLARLSLPWLVTNLALNPPSEPSATAIWSSASFGERGRLVSGGRVTFKVGTLDFGRGLQGSRASFVVEAKPDGLAVRELEATLGGGQITGSTSITRQGAMATVVGEGALRDVPLWALAGSSPFEGVLSGNLKFGSSGESVSALVANLGGAGEWRLANLRAPGADPTALERTIRRTLADNDPLAEGKMETVLGVELGRAVLAASSVATSAALVGGNLRLSPITAETPSALWQGAVTYDLKTLSLDARGSLVAKTSPAGWTGAAPSIGLNWTGSLAAPIRNIDAAPLRNGVAAIVLKRELEKIEAFERAAAERQRQIQAQQEAERLLRARAAEEAARQARARADAERARLDAQRLQNQQQAAPEEDAGTPPSLPPLGTPQELRPPPPIQTFPGN